MAVLSAIGAVAGVAVWGLVLLGALVQVVRGRSGAGAALGAASILGLALHLCGAGVAETLTHPLSGLIGPWVADAARRLLAGAGEAAVVALLVLGALLERPRPG